MSGPGAGASGTGNGAAPAARRLALTGEPGAVGLGRDFTRRALGDWHWIPEPADPRRQTLAADILLIVSELLANASMHAGGVVELVLHAAVPGGALRLEVVDADPTMPSPSAPRQPGMPGGHGLHIVEQLADRWGAVAYGSGKKVWAEIDTARLEADLKVAPPSVRNH